MAKHRAADLPHGSGVRPAGIGPSDPKNELVAPNHPLLSWVVRPPEADEWRSHLVVQTSLGYEPAFPDAEVGMSRALVVLGLASAVLLSGGCMSVANHSPYFCPDEAKRERVYGGVRLDVEGAGAALGPVARGEVSRPREVVQAVWVGGVLLGVDLPLCAVADTVLLPRTLRAQRQRRLAVPPPTPPEQSQPGNALAELAGNKFDAWTISHRVEFRPEPARVEVAPAPHRPSAGTE